VHGRSRHPALPLQPTHPSDLSVIYSLSCRSPYMDLGQKAQQYQDDIARETKFKGLTTSGAHGSREETERNE
jgi:hypothetical protein